MSSVRISVPHARRFMLRALGLTTPFRDVAEALAHHGFVQLDPINVCGRMHDLILRNRVAHYREGDLLRFLYERAEPSRETSSNAASTPTPALPSPSPLAPPERRAFEHYVEVLTAVPLDAWPYLAPGMRERARRTSGWGGKLSREEATIARHILREIERRGPLSSDDIEHESRSVTAWNSSARLVKVVLEKLFLHGRVLISTRRTFRRVYDLPERVIPPHVLAQPPMPASEVRRWQILAQVRQRRLVRLSRDDLARVSDAVQPVQVDHRAPVYCLREDVALVEACATPDTNTPHPVRLLAPLDPVIYDRELARRVWDFDYTWEVYTPPAKRVRGYYALPVLAGEAIVGHVDPKADRDVGRLAVVSRRVRRGFATSPAVRALAEFLGLRAG